jgi:hypothetical protein
MEFYSAKKTNEILLFTSKLIELENIIKMKLARLRKPKIACPPSYMDFRSKTNAVILLDMGHTLRERHTGGVGKGRKPKT